MAADKIHLEVFHEGEHWVPCVYMTRVVEAVALEYGDSLNWEKIVTKDLAGAKRYQDFSKALGRPAPVPCIVIEGKLVFDATPSTEALKACIDQFLKTAWTTADLFFCGIGRVFLQKLGYGLTNF